MTSEPALTVTREEAANILGCSPQNISYLVRRGHLRDVGLGRTCAILASSLAAYATRRRKSKRSIPREYQGGTKSRTRRLQVQPVDLTDLDERVARLEALVADLVEKSSQEPSPEGNAQRLIDMEEVALRLAAAAERLRDAGGAEARTSGLLREALNQQAQAADALRQADREREAAMLPLLVRPPND